jgi:outer membrane protein assembly factor BamB
MVLLQSCVPAWPQTVRTRTASRAIVQSGLSVHESWRKGNLVVRDAGGVLASENYVIFVDTSMGFNMGRLQVLDAATGQSQWQVTDLSVHSLATDRERLFIAVDWNIRTYNLSSGKLLWRTPGELPGHTSYSIYPMGAEILVYSTENSFQKSELVIRTYDASNGTLKGLSRTEKAPDISLILRSQSIEYWGDAEKLWAIDRSSGRTLWQIKPDGVSPYQLILAGPLIILSSTQFPSASVGLQAVDVRTGAIVWQYAGRCLSNFVLTNNTIYAIREDTALVGIDSQTGREVAAMRFATTKAADDTQYWVAATINKVFAYFGDSQELIAFAQ